MAEIDFNKLATLASAGSAVVNGIIPDDLNSYADWLNDTEQIKEAQEVFKAAEEDLKRELYFNSAVLEITKILDEYNKLHDSLSKMLDYLMHYDLQKPEVYKRIGMCRDEAFKSNAYFFDVERELYNILIEKEK